jgi:prepilin signal peptidase PulO-like enzyme (type II secretory pathway)
MLTTIYFFIFCLGLIVGSFLNCVIYRLKVKKSFLAGRSFCPKCKKIISWYDNIPLLSFIFLKGKCRHCQERISWQYPLVELAAGVLFVLVFLATIGQWNNGLICSSTFSSVHSLILLRNWIFTAILIVIFIYDLKYYLILDAVVFPAMVVALLLNILINIFNHEPLLSSFYLLISAAIGAGFFLLQFVISKGKWIGGGDIRLGALMGFMLPWPQILTALFFAYIIGSLVGVVLILTKVKGLKSQIPFGTFLSLGTLIALLYGEKIVAWYLNFY